MGTNWGLNAQRMTLNHSTGAICSQTSKWNNLSTSTLNAQCVHTLCTEARKRAPKPTGWQSHTKDRAFHDNHSPGKAKAKSK